MSKCLFCYKPLSEGEVDYHKSCARKIFESANVAILPYTRDNIKELARETVTSGTTVTGVQAKLSLDIARGHAGEPQRFIIVGLWGRYILKPQTERYANLPEDDEELALSLNGKKKRLKREDFEKAMRDSGMDDRSISKLFRRFSEAVPKWHRQIKDSFLPESMQESYIDKIDMMAKRLSIE